MPTFPLFLYFLIHDRKIRVYINKGIYKNMSTNGHDEEAIQIGKSDKITWGLIIEDFKKRHPRLSKDISYWFPCGIATIEIHILGGLILEYNYDFHKAIIKQEERED